MSAAIHLSPWDLALAAALMLIPAMISILLKLGMVSKLGLASVRTVVQLALLGLVLEWVFDLARWYLVVPVLLMMLIVAAHTAIARSKHTYPWARVAAFGTLILVSTLTTFSVTEVIVGVDPWYEPRYVIPLMGMVLGNSLTGISLGLDRLLSDLVQNRAPLEARLSLGASLWHAVLPGLREAIRNGMIPIINAMMIVGIVSLPGMMTGQLLAGADPQQAVAYQILIMFMIASTVALGVIEITLLSYHQLKNPEVRIRWEQIRKQK